MALWRAAEGVREGPTRRGASRCSGLKRKIVWLAFLGEGGISVREEGRWGKRGVLLGLDSLGVGLDGRPCFD